MFGFTWNEPMATYIALLRGVNIGGNTLKMDRLKSLCADLGFDNVRTYVQSGNVLFNCESTALACLKGLEEKLSGQTRLPVTVIIRKPADLKKVLRNNPFPDAVASGAPGADSKKPGETARLYVAFLASSPDRARMKALEELSFGRNQFQIAGKEIYLRYAEGYGTSKMTNNLFEKVLAIRATTRNWNTVTKLSELAGG